MTMRGSKIERKFLLRPCSPRKHLDAIGVTYNKYDLEQYYLAIEKFRCIFCIKEGEQFFKTIKNTYMLNKNSEEKSISEEEYLNYYDQHIGRVIHKDRFIFEYDGIIYKLDRFKKNIKGLFQLEIDFDNEQSATSFVLPEIFSNLYLMEVTHDSRFDNRSLCQPGRIPPLQTNLEKLSRKMEIILPTQINEFPLLIEPFESTETAMLAIFRNKIEIIKTKRKLLLEDTTDSQKLHDFWLSIRKLRALMGEFEHLLSPTWYTRHRKNISMMMRQTDAKRDLDIFLNSLDNYNRQISEKKQKNLQPLLDILHIKSKNLEPKIEGLVNSELLDYEIESLTKPMTRNCKKQEDLLQPIVITSMQILNNRITRIIKAGKMMDFSSKSNAHSNLRIEFKNLCTFIENTKPFIINEKYSRIIELIRVMEALLGRYYDLEFQRLLILSLKNEPALRKDKTKKSIERLETIISDLQKETKNSFKIEFNYFAKEEKRLMQLFRH